MKDFLAANPKFKTRVKSELGITALHYAAMSKDPKLLGYVLTFARGSINSKTVNYLTPLHYAAITGPLQSVKMLVAKGANPYALTYENECPVEIAEPQDVFEYLDSITLDTPYGGEESDEDDDGSESGE